MPRSGKVVLFGGLCSPPAGAAPPPATPEQRAAAADAQRLGFAVVAAPAPIKSMAAGLQHVVLTDGERLWAVGRWLDADGQEAGSAPFYAPAELLHLPAEGIRKVVAGPHSTGAVSGDGRLFVSGRLVDRHHGEAVGGGPRGLSRARAAGCWRARGEMGVSWCVGLKRKPRTKPRPSSSANGCRPAPPT